MLVGTHEVELIYLWVVAAANRLHAYLSYSDTEVTGTPVYHAHFGQVLNVRGSAWSRTARRDSRGMMVFVYIN